MDNNLINYCLPSPVTTLHLNLNTWFTKVEKTGKYKKIIQEKIDSYNLKNTTVIYIKYLLIALIVVIFIVSAGFVFVVTKHKYLKKIN
jgi:hypothetical protein